MNKKGFTLVELITTFSLSAIIIVILINVVLIIKNMSSEENMKTKLFKDQSYLSNVLNSKINGDNVISYRPCNSSNFCYNFTLNSGEIVKLEVSDTYIKAGDYTYNIKDNVEVENMEVRVIPIEVSDTKMNNSFLIIKIPITYKLYPNEDFGINLVYPFNSNIHSL